MDFVIEVFDQARDGDQVLALWREVFAGDPPHNEPRAMIERKKAVQPELFLVARQGTELHGSLIGGYDGVRGWMHHLATRPSSRRSGVARLLVNALEVRLKAAGCVKLNLRCGKGTKSSRGSTRRWGTFRSLS